LEIPIESADVLDNIPHRHCPDTGTGLRSCEGNGLKVGYLDFGRRRLRVREAFVDGAQTTLKNRKTRRDIPLSPNLAAGENPLFVSRLLGHSSTKMLFERYAPFVANALADDGSQFERMMAEVGAHY
jgi:hypothetical protein